MRGSAEAQRPGSLRRRRARVAVTAITLAASAAAPPVARASIPAEWLAATGGSWTDAAKWSTSPTAPNNGQPNSGDTYAAAIALAAAAPYTVTINAAAA